MKFIILMVILAVLLAAGFWGYTVWLHVDPEEHNYHQAESATRSDSHDDHAEHDESESAEPAIELSQSQIIEIGLETALAGPGTVDVHIRLPGEIKVNQDRIAHIVPRVQGVVVDVRKKLGDTVAAEDIIAVIESRELADAKAAYLTAVERVDMAGLAFSREEKLWRENITSEEEYLGKKQALTEAGIEKRTAEQKLFALGFDTVYLQKFTHEPEQVMTRLDMRAPLAGTIIEQHIVRGELVGTESLVCTIADLSTVWVDLHVYPRDIGYIKIGQSVVISADSEMSQAEGVISYIGPMVGEETRTILARVVLANTTGEFRPGLFVTARTVAASKRVNIVVPKEAVQSREGRKCVFIKDEHGFKPVNVEIGLENTRHVEILSGLAAGQEYVVKGAFALKSTMITSTLDSHAGHGH